MFGSVRLKAVICNSKMVKDEIRNYFGVAEEKLHVIYSGVDTRVFHPDLKRHRAAVRAQYVVPENAALFLFVGSGFARKGVSTLLEAMARLSAGTYLLVVGHDKNLEKYRARAQPVVRKRQPQGMRVIESARSTICSTSSIGMT